MPVFRLTTEYITANVRLTGLYVRRLRYVTSVTVVIVCQGLSGLWPKKIACPRHCIMKANKVWGGGAGVKTNALCFSILSLTSNLGGWVGVMCEARNKAVSFRS